MVEGCLKIGCYHSVDLFEANTHCYSNMKYLRNWWQLSHIQIKCDHHYLFLWCHQLHPSRIWSTLCRWPVLLLDDLMNQATTAGWLCLFTIYAKFSCCKMWHIFKAHFFIQNILEKFVNWIKYIKHKFNVWQWHLVYICKEKLKTLKSQTCF